MRLSILGAGFIGLNFIRSPSSKEFDITVLDSNPCPIDLIGKVNWIQGDFFSQDKLLAAIKNSETIFHFISTTVPGDEVDEASELGSNVGQTLALLKLCLKEKVKRVVFISSASVYGIQFSAPISELAPTNPISSHGISKLTIEKYLEFYKYNYGLDCKILRLSNPYGPGQNVKGRQGFIAIAIGKIMSGEKLIVRGDGSIVRDYIYIEDVSSALRELSLTTSDISLFNIGSGIGYSLNEVLQKLSALMGKSILVDYGANRFVDIPSSILDVSRAGRVLKYKTHYTFDQGLLLTLEHHKIKVTV
ncbi:NAD-dependent epimerase/dehydratase family protein [Polynucleobacter sp. AM-26B4]|uniref:NAD-dependent epimerase/dehydratase family protein n=1 Tax=Polynucleobacter sp. AM-26B4 TaxID=2689103 RepID=UPI001C0E4699|nr:NAD-dependent epimerase/dehydratase family protein [Polynucleobacter sp. AM-26B4]MBU3585132.1 NAD-dependent epimerase/dehydratase family protein [Polynucleobacter sp. AM-26B4]